jgi:hypothetical protein
LILVVAPWSGFWDRNLFFGAMPAMDAIFASPFARGAVSGVGAITVIAGLAELVGIVSHRRRPKPDAASPGPDRLGAS